VIAVLLVCMLLLEMLIDLVNSLFVSLLVLAVSLLLNGLSLVVHLMSNVGSRMAKGNWIQ